MPITGAGSREVGLGAAGGGCADLCLTPGCLIEELLEQRQSHYTWLEDNHSYIQW